MKKTASFSIVYVVIGFLISLLLQPLLSTNVKNISYSKFMNLISEGKISSVVVSQRYLKGYEKLQQGGTAPLFPKVVYHAVMAAFRPTAEKVHRISIIPRGIGALGFTLQLPTEDRYLMSRTELLEKIDVLLGGRAAEIIIFEDVTTGAQNDLQKATEIAHSMVALYGMNEKLGPVTYRQPPSPYLQAPGVFLQKEMREDTARMIDDEVRSIIESRMESVLETLHSHEDLLHEISTRLLEKETIDGEEFTKLVFARQPKVAAAL